MKADDLIYTVVGYDKDNDVYIEFVEYSVEMFAFMKAQDLANMVKRGELKREDNGEPIDWIEIYEYWGSPNEHRIYVI